VADGGDGRFDERRLAGIHGEVIELLVEIVEEREGDHNARDDRDLDVLS